MREWLERAIAGSTLTEEARYYLLGRGATDQVIRDWNLTCFESPVEPCPDQALHPHYGAHFERIEGKLVFPLYSPRGVLLGFDSRTEDKKDLLRFLLPDAHWNPVWIGMPRAMDGVWRRKTIYVVEGIFDVFALYRVVGENSVVLGSGPARLSRQQLDFLSRWAQEVCMVYDQDDTGRRGAAQAVKNLRYRGVSCREIFYRGGKDPGEIWDRGGDESLHKAFPHL